MRLVQWTLFADRQLLAYGLILCICPFEILDLVAVEVPLAAFSDLRGPVSTPLRPSVTAVTFAHDHVHRQSHSADENLSTGSSSVR
jgi:hypothetical protein